jgi:hypothetical protein
MRNWIVVVKIKVSSTGGDTTERSDVSDCWRRNNELHAADVDVCKTAVNIISYTWQRFQLVTSTFPERATQLPIKYQELNTSP